MMPALALALLLASAAAQGPFDFGGPPREEERPFKRSQCKSIPPSLQLCRDMEYSDMRLPNLVLGRKMDDGRLVVTSLKRWQKGRRDFKRISRSVRKLQCW